MIKKIAGILAGVVLLFYSCYNDKGEILYGTISCEGVNTSFAENIFFITQTNCAVADSHAAGSANGPGSLTSYAQIKNVAVEIKSAVVSRFMPKTGSLTTSQIKAITSWVDAGELINKIAFFS